MEVTAMTSADPVEVTAMSMRISIRNSPVFPMSLCATAGATKPTIHNQF